MDATLWNVLSPCFIGSTGPIINNEVLTWFFPTLRCQATLKQEWVWLIEFFSNMGTKKIDRFHYKYCRWSFRLNSQVQTAYPPTKKQCYNPTGMGAGVGPQRWCYRKHAAGNVNAPNSIKRKLSQSSDTCGTKNINNVLVDFSPNGVPTTMGNFWQCLVLTQTMDVFRQRNAD